MQIATCDELLGNVEGRLEHFDVELSTVNREIQTLEEDSEEISIMLRNRIDAADRLGSWLQETTVSPDLILAVRDSDVDDAERYTETLQALKRKDAHMKAFMCHETLPAYPTLQVRIQIIFNIQARYQRPPTGVPQ
jgi:septal ring factor EnvC (AmiA/AmiB activator)